MTLSLQETLGYTRLFVIVINLRITFKMKVILNCPPKEESKYCEKIKSSNWKGNSFYPSASSPSKFQKDSSSPKITIYWQTYIHSEKEHFFGDNCSEDSCLQKSQYQCLLKLPDSWEGGYDSWMADMRVLDGFRYRTLWYVCMTWYGKNNALSSSWNVPTYSPTELTCLTLCLKLTVVPHFPNTYLLEFSWIYTYDLRMPTQVHLLCLENLHSEIMETMRIYGVG